jgi:hypothetical protein
MVLVDTSVWVEHLRHGSVELEALLDQGEVLCHQFIIGEVACGGMKNRAEILSLLQTLPRVIPARHVEVMTFLENHRLMGKGLGYIDMHLLASAVLTEAPLWTLDKNLNAAAAKLGLAA